jgi:hypothetical protein
LSRSVLSAPPISSGSGGLPSPIPSAGGTYTGETKRIGQLDVKLVSCRSVGLCEALVTNLGQEANYCLDGGQSASRVIDAHSNVYTPSNVRLAQYVDNYSGPAACGNIPSNVPVVSRLLFMPGRGNNRQSGEPPSEGTRLELVHFSFTLQGTRSSLNAQFRGVLVTR